ncbi:hypothetical protein NDK47_24705 [Brevibacillus ruminantium]|uniref:Peptidase n=1 Tax=Brevibacillus ruminantium TaxID=2950604 RepID=A0ABY4WDM1_9BACL|nr:hypothetical protein [Brevibacillus ruminantium]USG65271.1 hypothetical protein NDK47_24705 [Brevibacillus ruminantium]
MNRYRKHAVKICAGVVATAGLLSFPLASSSLALAANAETPVTPTPVPISKGIQNVTRLLPDLKSMSVQYEGPVDGPGVSGDMVSFVTASKAANAATNNRAIFDSQTGNLLVLELQPAEEKGQTGKLSDEMVKTKAASFLYGLHPYGKMYEASSVTRQDGTSVVRFVRKHNQIALSDPYDCLVTVDATGRIVGFQTFSGAMYETIDPKGMPSAQRVMSYATAMQRYTESKPLELVYLVEDQLQPAAAVENEKIQAPLKAHLVYAVKGGIVKGSHTGSALDAMTGKTMSTADDQAKTLSITGKGNYATLKSEAEVKAFAKDITGVDLGKLPLTDFSYDRGDGKKAQVYLWGSFDKEIADEEKPFHLGQFPSDVKADSKLHILVEVDEKTGKLIRMVKNDGTEPRKQTDKARDLKAAVSWIERLLPAGAQQFRIYDAGTTEMSRWIADPLKEGVPVYRKGQFTEDGAFVIAVNPVNGSILELTAEPYDQVTYPERKKAVTEQAALSALLKAYPLELSYVKIWSKAERATEATEPAPEWKLAYDLSFRQSRAHCFCGGEEKVDTTVYIDALTGKVVVDE